MPKKVDLPWIHRDCPSFSLKRAVAFRPTIACGLALWVNLTYLVCLIVVSNSVCEQMSKFSAKSTLEIKQFDLQDLYEI